MKSCSILLQAILFSGILGCASTNNLIDSGLWHYRAGLWGEASYRLQQGIPRLEKSNPADPRLPTALDALGEIAQSGGRKDLAEGFFRRAVQLAQQEKPVDDKLLRNALVSQGHFYLTEKRYGEAESVLQQASIISERNSTFPRTLFAIDLDNLGQVYAAEGLHEKATELSEKALSVVDSVPLEADAALTRGVIYYNLASAYDDQKRDVEAESAYKRSIDILTDVCRERSGERWRIDAAKNGYATFLRKLGRK